MDNASQKMATRRNKKIESMSVTAIVLAGGQGSRMNHQDKAWIQHRGKPLIHHVLDKISPQVDAVIISRNRSHSEFEHLPYQCFSDQYEDYQGPLAGIASCIPYINADLALIVPCDTPNLPEDLVSRFTEEITGSDLAVAVDKRSLQPLIFLSRTQTLGSITDYLGTGRRSVMGWLETVNCTEVPFDEQPDAFENINKISQLQ